MDIKKFYGSQISLSEWMQNLNLDFESKFKQEDNSKRERLKTLNEIIDLPFDRPLGSFMLNEIIDKSEGFTKFLKNSGTELCALRLIPLKPNLPKLRIRGLKVFDSVNDWLPNQKIEKEHYNNYNCDFIPHSSVNIYSTIFIVNSQGIFGEIIKGQHHQLTQGFYLDQNEPIQFYFNFKELKLSKTNILNIKDFELELIKVFNLIKVSSLDKQEVLRNTLKCTFNNYFIEGYFETITTPKYGVWFLDYNRLIELDSSNLNLNFEENQTSIVKGKVANNGKVTAKVSIVSLNEVDDFKFIPGNILVCKMTSPKYLPIMKISSGIITDQGGILSHAAIVSRELNIPCIVGTRNATEVLKDDMLIEIDTYVNSIKIVH